MTTLELQKLMQTIVKDGPKHHAYVLLAIPFGSVVRDAKWICNCVEEDGKQLVIDTATTFTAERS
jgi:hypothetical protein